MENTNRVELSVVVTVYNTSKFLNRCLDSLNAQKNKEIEIIVVDDGSTDESGEICDTYEKIDKRVKVIHKSNEGLINARITGLDNSSGEFVTFVDSDDWIEKDAFNRVIHILKTENPDIICTDIKSDSGKISNKITGKTTYGVYKKNQIDERVIPNMLFSGTFFRYGIEPFMFGKIYRTNRLRQIYDYIPNDIDNGEDAAATYAYIIGCRCMLVTDISFYHYVRRPGSMSYSKVMYLKAFNSNKNLYHYLKNVFSVSASKEILLSQLNSYMTYMTIGLCPDRIDNFFNQSLAEFGTVPDNSKVVVYGAGNFGVRLYEYIKSLKKVTCVGWLDKNASFFVECGYPVEIPECVENMEYDFVLISIINAVVADEIRGELVNQGVPDEKIRFYLWENIPIEKIYEN